MRFVILFFALLLPNMVSAFSIDSSIIKLECPNRGAVEVMLHRYSHTQERWGKDNFETGAVFLHIGKLFLFEFANQDMMIYSRSEKTFKFWYKDARALVNCKLLSINETYPITLPRVNG